MKHDVVMVELGDQGSGLLTDVNYHPIMDVDRCPLTAFESSNHGTLVKIGKPWYFIVHL